MLIHSRYQAHHSPVWITFGRPADQGHCAYCGKIRGRIAQGQPEIRRLERGPAPGGGMYREVVAWIEGQADLIFCHNGQCAEGWLSATPEEREERLARNDERMRSRSSGLKTRAIAAGHIQGVVVDDRIKREANEVVVFMHSRRIIRHEASIERARRLMAEVIAALSKLEQNDREALDAAQKALVGR